MKCDIHGKLEPDALSCAECDKKADAAVLKAREIPGSPASGETFQDAVNKAVAEALKKKEDVTAAGNA